MTTESFGWSTPGITDTADGHTIATGLTFGVTAAGQISAISVYSPTVAPSSLVFHLYEVTDQTSGTLLASKTVTLPAGGTTVTATLDTPISITTDRAYRAAVYNPDGHYVATLGAFSSADTTSGHLVAYKTGTSPFGSVLVNGDFVYDSDVYPSSGSAGTNFHLDVVFTPAATVVDAVLSATLPTLSGAFAGDELFDGVLSATLPTLTAAFTGDERIDGTLAASLAALTATFVDFIPTASGFRYVQTTPPGRYVQTTPAGREAA